VGPVGLPVVAQILFVPRPALRRVAASGDEHRQEQGGDDGKDDDGER
jgi:hypothetical protein